MSSCRCCLSQKCDKNIFHEYYWMGQKEVFSDMLSDTFNIKIYPQELMYRNGICDKCVAIMREAVMFKLQVLRVEKLLTQAHFNINDDDISALNSEYECKDEFYDNISVDFEDDDFSNNEDNGCQDNQILNIDDSEKKEDKDNLFIIKMSTVQSSVDDSKLLADINIEERQSDIAKQVIDDKFEIHQDDENSLSNISEPFQSENRIKQIRDNKMITGKKKLTKENVQSKKNKKTMRQSDKDIRENTLKLILNSNLCLFESLKTKFRCFSCKESYLNIKELRNHSQLHDSSIDMSKRIYRLRGLSYKFAEISNLKCKLCSESCEDLTYLREHLIKIHEIKFSDTGEHFLIPYRIENDFPCIVCNENFNTFLRLSIHTNTHYANNVCDICGASYINRLSLRMHVNAVHREKKCSVCSAVFLTQNLRVKHMRKYHKSGTYRRYCLICDKTFPYTYQLVEHKIQEHGMVRKIVSCNQCDKTFNTAQNLKIHIRSVHIRERNYHCSMCDMRFFTKCDQMRHETSHDMSKSFSCSMCDVKFKTKDSVRRHLRKQHGLL